MSSTIIGGNMTNAERIHFNLLMQYQCHIAEKLLELFTPDDVCKIIFQEGHLMRDSFELGVPLENELTRIKYRNYKLLFA